jgi:alpha-galactosidase
MNLKKVIEHRDIKISWRGKTLVIENNALIRELDMESGMPVSRRLVNKRQKKELLASNKSSADFSYSGFFTPFAGVKDNSNAEAEGLQGDQRTDTVWSMKNISAEICKASIFHPEHVRICLHLKEDIQKLEYLREYFIYPDIPVMASRSSIKSEVAPKIFASSRSDLNYRNNRPELFFDSPVDSCRLASSPAELKSVIMTGRTDNTNEFVTESILDLDKKDQSVKGNLLFAGTTEGGLFFLQEAPPSEERRDIDPGDFRIIGNDIYSLCWGIRPEEINDKEWLRSYTHVIGVYDGTEDDALGVLKNYLRLRFPQEENHCSTTINPWGTGKFPQYVSQQFLLDEIKAAPATGGELYQIDDGWQVGEGLGRITQNNESVDEKFWKVDKEMLPAGFEALLETAKTAGIDLGLWIAPSENKNFNDWEMTLEIIYSFYRKFGIRFYKIDGVIVRTKKAEDNLEKMCRILRERSKGEIYFNFDVTNGQRAGYFMNLEYGNMFLENRYLYGTGGVRDYHPQKTLHNLWCLAKYVRTPMLQIEIGDPGCMAPGNYTPGAAKPHDYPPAYWAAVAMFASPLLWFSPSLIDPETAEKFKKVLEMHKRYRNEIFAGDIFPIGKEPDGKSWTGFQSYNMNTGHGFVVVYRELNAPETGILSLKYIKDSAIELQFLNSSDEDIQKAKNSTDINILIPIPGDFRLLRY